MRGVLADLLAACGKRQQLQLLYATIDGQAQLMLEVPSSLKTTAEKFLHAKYSGIQLKRLPQGPGPDRGQLAWSKTLRLKPDVQPLILRKNFHDDMQRNYVDPVSTLLQAIQDISEDSVRGKSSVRSLVRLHVTPVTTWQRWRAKRIVQRLNHPWWETHTVLKDQYAHFANGSWYQQCLSWPVGWFVSRRAATANESLAKIDSHLTQTSVEITTWSKPVDQAAAQKQLTVVASAFAEFSEPGRAQFVVSKTRRGVPRKAPTSLLSVDDLAQLWHLPTETVHTPTLAQSTFRELKPPINLPTQEESKGAARLGQIAFQGDKRICFQPPEDRLHTWLIGKSGTGKSTLINNLVAHDAFHGEGFAVIDPHGDLIDDIVKTLPKSRTNDIILFDPSDPNHVVPLNLLENNDPKRRSLVASSLVAALQRIFAFDSQNAPRLTDILNNSVLALMEHPEATLVDIRRMLVDKQFRSTVVSSVTNEHVRSYWLDEVANWTPRYESEALPAVLNKLGHFTRTEEVQRIISQPRGSLNLRQVMDEQKILLVKLPQGILGNPAATFLASLMVAGIQQAVMTRADIDKDARHRFYLYADEYLTYANESFGVILSQARKYGLYLTAAQQFLPPDQKELMAAMFGNVSTILSFQLAFDDAEVMANQLGSPLEPADFISLPKYHAVTRIAIDGVPSRPFTLKTLPPPSPSAKTALEAAVRKQSRLRYSGVSTTHNT